MGYASLRLAEFEWRGRWPNLTRYYDRLRERESLWRTVPYPQNIADAVV